MSILLVLAQAVVLNGSIQQGILVRPDTVRVGEPFTVTIRLRAPLGSTIRFPTRPDSSLAIEPLDPVQTVSSVDSMAQDQTATYRLAAWRTGGFSIRFPDVEVSQEIGTRRVPVTGASVMVVSVLPSAPEERLPRPARPIFAMGMPLWMRVLGLLVPALLALLLWRLVRRRRARPAPRPAPYVIAEREFTRIESLGLMAAGEQTRYADLMTEVLRDYLAAVIPGASRAQTTAEFSVFLRRSASGVHGRCLALLKEVDLAKFAGKSIPAERAGAIGREARAIALVVRDNEPESAQGRAA